MLELLEFSVVADGVLRSLLLISVILSFLSIALRMSTRLQSLIVSINHLWSDMLHALRLVLRFEQEVTAATVGLIVSRAIAVGHLLLKLTTLAVCLNLIKLVHGR